MEVVERHASFGGTQLVCEHLSAATGTTMRVGVYLPPGRALGDTKRAPALYFLSGLTCSEQNVITKAGVQQYAAQHDVIIIAPDTSPRGEGVADADGWDLGVGASFYVDATQPPWSRHYRMWTYMTDELPQRVAASLPVDPLRQGITGHSMGGHGALVCALRNPDRFRSVSAFAPICAPSDCPWGVKAFTAYLGDDRAAWADYDASRLLASRGWHGDILVDQGADDGFLGDGQLQPEALQRAGAEAGVTVTVRRHAGYDHSYYFIASFIGDHVAWHAERLRG